MCASIRQSPDIIPDFSKGERLSLGNGKNLKIKYPEIEDRSTERGKIIYDTIFPSIDPYLLTEEVINEYEKIVDLSHRDLIELYEKKPDIFTDFHNELKLAQNRREELVKEIANIFNQVVNKISEPKNEDDSLIHNFYYRMKQAGGSLVLYDYKIDDLSKIKAWLEKIV